MQMEITVHSRGYYVGLVVMGLFYVVSGLNHFRNLQAYLPIMPPYIPWPGMMIYISGAAEILGGIGVLMPDGLVFPRTRAFAAWGIVALLIAVSPVHINMCIHPENFPQIPLWVIWVRLPLQLPLIAWALNYTRR
ncbi:DoxX family protein [Acidicapsa ligni]|uniref:DoxX family protein n=1 Tax=Acidicapsa ligni TaxID=542300 RepID=UPI0021E0047F|nr:DoxX family protein [Acidicapsa ligni]